MNRFQLPKIIRSRGFTLVELMIAMLLGLLIIAGVISVFLSNKQSYRTNQALGEVQDGSRLAFEMLARDIRQAGGTACGNTARIANVLNNSTTGGSNWWADWNNAVHGYDDATADPALTATGAGAPVASQSSIQLMHSASDGALSVVNQNKNAANFTVNETTPVIPDGAIVIVCDPDHATILQVNKGNSGNVTVEYNTGNANSPGNCSKGLGFPTDCSSPNGNQYTFGANSQIAQLAADDWYIGTNPVGGRSLYRVALAASGTDQNSVTSASPPQEMVRNVTGMQIQYLQGGTNFVSAASVTDWSQVTAARVILTVQSTDQRAGTDMQPLTRQYTTTVTMRNRVD